MCISNFLNETFNKQNRKKTRGILLYRELCFLTELIVPLVYAYNVLCVCVFFPNACAYVHLNVFENCYQYVVTLYPLVCILPQFETVKKLKICTKND